LYFIPGNSNGKGNTSSQRKNKKRLFLYWIAVFILVSVALIRVFKPFLYHHPDIFNLSGAKTHIPPIDPGILKNADFGLPLVKQGDEIVRHYAYTLDFSDKDKEPFWVAYIFRKSYLQGELKRANHFESDPDVRTGSASLDDYRHSGYDKGHMAPAGDMKWDERAMSESFYLSNVCPQNHKCNDGIWADLEKAVRYWANDDSIEYIVTGPILPAPGSPKIGEDHVTVPAYFYKVVFSPYPSPKAVGFIIPNQPEYESFWHYACSVNQVEKATGIDFFPQLPANIATALKSEYEMNDWKSTESFNQ